MRILLVIYTEIPIRNFECTTPELYEYAKVHLKNTVTKKL